MACLDLADGLVGIHHIGQLEKTDLHDGIDALAHAGFTGHPVGIDRVQPDVLSTICCTVRGSCSHS